MTSATPKPRAGGHVLDRNHTDGIPDYPSRSYQHEAGYRTVPWDDWIGMRQHAIGFQAERDALLNALQRAVGWVGATGNGKPLVDPRQIDDYNLVRTLLAKHGR